MRALGNCLMAIWPMAIWLSGCCAGGARRAAEERTLRTNLVTMRALIGQVREDFGAAPVELAEIVERGYLRTIPYDPLTRRNDRWIVVREPAPPYGIVDVRSGAGGTACDGTAYASW